MDKKFFDNTIIAQYAVTGVPLKVYVDSRYLTITDADDVENPLIGQGMEPNGEMEPFSYQDIDHLLVADNIIDLETYNTAMADQFKSDEPEEAPEGDEEAPEEEGEEGGDDMPDEEVPEEEPEEEEPTTEEGFDPTGISLSEITKDVKKAREKALDAEEKALKDKRRALDDEPLDELTLGGPSGEAMLQDLHLETDPAKQKKMKIKLGREKYGAYSDSSALDDADYALKKFRQQMRGYKGDPIGVYDPSKDTYKAKAPKQVVADKPNWNQKKYDRWIDDVSSNEGWRNAYDMAQNANYEPGLIDWVKKNVVFNDETPLERIQYDIEAMAESVNEGFTKKDWDVKWKMPKDNLFNATKTKNAVDNRYKALQNLLKDKPKELKAFDATDDHPAYDMSYDELMKWYNNLSESVNEATNKKKEGNPFKKGDKIIVTKLQRQGDAKRFKGKKGFVLRDSSDNYVMVKLKGFSSPEIEFHKGEIELDESVNEATPPTDATIKPHMNTYTVADDPYEVAVELGKKYGWNTAQIEKAEKLIRKKYIMDSVNEAFKRKYTMKESKKIREAKGRPYGLSKEETLEVAKRFAKALSITDGVKVTVNMTTLDEDSFDLDYDGVEFDGGSYNIYDDGAVKNMATMKTPTIGYKDDSVQSIVKYLKKHYGKLAKNEAHDFPKGPSKAGLKRLIKDVEEMLDTEIDANGDPLTNETEMILQKELKRLTALLRESVNEADGFAGADPKAGSMIQGRGFERRSGNKAANKLDKELLKHINGMGISNSDKDRVKGYLSDAPIAPGAKVEDLIAHTLKVLDIRESVNEGIDGLKVGDKVQNQYDGVIATIKSIDGNSVTVVYDDMKSLRNEFGPEAKEFYNQSEELPIAKFKKAWDRKEYIAYPFSYKESKVNEANSYDSWKERGNQLEKQAMADAINAFGKVAKRKDLDELAELYFNDIEFNGSEYIDAYKIVLKKYKLIDAFNTYYSSYITDVDPAGGHGPMSHESVNEDVSSPYIYQVGDLVHNTDSGCACHGSKGIVMSVEPEELTYSVTNSGDTFKPGMRLTKALSQLEAI